VKVKDFDSMTVSRVMEKEVQYVRLRAKGDVIASLMIKGFGAVPVVENGRKLTGIVSEHALIRCTSHTEVGIVTEYDLLQAMIEGRDIRKILATEAMSSHPVAVTEDQTLAQVADLFQDCYLTRVPVVRNNKLVGILARRDLLFGYMKPSPYWA